MEWKFILNFVLELLKKEKKQQKPTTRQKNAFQIREMYELLRQ